MSTQQIPLDLKSVPAFGREDFFLSACNEFAVHWIEKWPDGWTPFPALVLYGERGSGKTHLAEVWRKRSHADFISVDDFIQTSVDTILSSQRNVIFLDW